MYEEEEENRRTEEDAGMHWTRWRRRLVEVVRAAVVDVNCYQNLQKFLLYSFQLESPLKLRRR